jgi:hypothetical protein
VGTSERITKDVNMANLYLASPVSRARVGFTKTDHKPRVAGNY